MHQSLVRVSDDILNKLREILPEFRDESEANLVRVALRKFIYEYEEGRILPREDYERQALKLLKELAEKEKKE